MAPTVTTRDVSNWQTLLQIVRLLPSSNQSPLISFTDPGDAVQFMHQQDPPGKRLCLLTNDALLFWIVPISVVEQLSEVGFYRIFHTINL